MSGRNWTRRSIEELVEAYLRGKKVPSSGGDSYCVYDVSYCGISANDPVSQSSISVGYLNNTPEIMTSGHSYYPPLTGAPADYIEGGYTVYGQTRASQYSGSKSLVSGGFVTGKIVKSGGGNNARTFTVITVPKTCTLNNLKNLIVRVGAGKMPLTGHMALVTSDYANMDAEQINRTMYVAYSGGKPMYFTGDNECWYNYLYGRAIYTPRSGNEYYIEDANSSARFTKTGQYISASSYNMFHNLTDGGATYIAAFRMGESTNTNLNTFFNSVKNNYDGTLTYGSDTRNLNFLTFIILSDGSASDDTEEVERQLYYLSRLFVDNIYEDTPFHGSDGKPRFISEKPTFGTPIEMFIYGYFSNNSMVQYNKEYVTIT